MIRLVTAVVFVVGCIVAISASAAPFRPVTPYQLSPSHALKFKVGDSTLVFTQRKVSDPFQCLVDVQLQTATVVSVGFELFLKNGEGFALWSARAISDRSSHGFSKEGLPEVRLECWTNVDVYSALPLVP